MKMIRKSEVGFTEVAQERYDVLAANHARLSDEVAAENVRIAAEHEARVAAANEQWKQAVDGIREAHRIETERVEDRRAELTAEHELYVGRYEQFVEEVRATHSQAVANARQSHAQHLKDVEAFNAAAEERAAESSLVRKTLAKLGVTLKYPDAVEKVEPNELVLPEPMTLPDAPTEPELPELPPEPELPPKPKLPKPELLGLPHEPVEPDPTPTYTVKVVSEKDVEDEPWLWVDTPDGPARAPIGAAILEHDVTGDKHVVAAEDLELHYARAPSK